MILEGYREGLQSGGRPFVLEENHDWLREAAWGELRDPVQFWKKMDGLPTVKGDIPKGARKGLDALLPERGLPYRVAHRVAGLGSLGRERFVALADWRGGRVAREAKALLPSACCLGEQGTKALHKIFYEDIITSAARVLDPFVHLWRWIVRRLAPHCSRIDWPPCPKTRRGTPAARHGLRDGQRPPGQRESYYGRPARPGQAEARLAPYGRQRDGKGRPERMGGMEDDLTHISILSYPCQSSERPRHQYS